jgi:ribonuclease HI
MDPDTLILMCESLETKDSVSNDLKVKAFLLATFLKTQSKEESLRYLKIPRIDDLVHSIRLVHDCGWNSNISTNMVFSVFTDGSCINNGHQNSMSAYAFCVFRDNELIYKFSDTLSPTEPHTNQRAELHALYAAINYVSENGTSAIIYTDSQYAINSLLVWGPVWAKNGWHKSDGKPVLHTDILIPMFEIMNTLGHKIKIRYVEAHTNKTDFISRGNSIVDKMAYDTAFSHVRLTNIKNEN